MDRLRALPVALASLVVGSVLGVGAVHASAAWAAGPKPAQPTITSPSLKVDAKSSSLIKLAPTAAGKIDLGKIVRPPLLTKAALANIVKVQPDRLEEPVTLTMSTPQRPHAHLEVACATYLSADPRGGYATFRENDCALTNDLQGVWVFFDAVVDKSYAVECSGRSSHWKMSVMREDESGFVTVNDTSTGASDHPIVVVRAEATTRYLVGFRNPQLGITDTVFGVTDCRITPIAL